MPCVTSIPSTADPKLGRGENILLVEDDPSVLALGIEMLNGLGYRVVTASDAAGALEILKRGDHVDLVFTDVVMPGGRTGVQLAVEARELRPGIKVLLTSGYTGEALARHQTETMPLIEKPFRAGRAGGAAPRDPRFERAGRAIVDLD